ncbi:MAG: hypothetical protein E4G98_04775 [Promethearchaeota archaeon]|nr:MAG: hypothetical protein E4G98_04775 [Candidatus Lokiarchaeota archaeon]
MEINFDAIDLNGLDLELVFWEEILKSGYTIREEIKNQVWTFLYYYALDLLPNPDPSPEEDQSLHDMVDQYILTEKVQTWIEGKTAEIATFLKENPPVES